MFQACQRQLIKTSAPFYKSQSAWLKREESTQNLKIEYSRKNLKMSARSVTGKRPNEKTYSPDKEDVYLQDMERWKNNRRAAKQYFRSFSNVTATNVRSYIENNESPNTQPHDYETCQLRCCRVQRPNAGGVGLPA